MGRGTRPSATRRRLGGGRRVGGRQRNRRCKWRWPWSGGRRRDRGRAGVVAPQGGGCHRVAGRGGGRRRPRGGGVSRGALARWGVMDGGLGGGVPCPPDGAGGRHDVHLRAALLQGSSWRRCPSLCFSSLDAARGSRPLLITSAHTGTVCLAAARDRVVVFRRGARCNGLSTAAIGQRTSEPVPQLGACLFGSLGVGPAVQYSDTVHAYRGPHNRSSLERST